MLTTMRRTLILLGFLALGIFLLANPITGVFAPDAEEPATTVAAATTQPTSTTGAPPAAGETTTTAGATTTTATSEVFTGPPVSSEGGYFQVEITVVDGVMTSVDLIDQPDDSKSQRINDSAVPRYEAQALELQSTDLDRISGATFTWRYFRESLEGAMEAAGLISI
ncbi:MAG: hypothetical protein A2135_10385 [Actinobacteria bacterium RBG_16_67_15]|nr:MAG: hypothetical protein A2135_10385 [Actinobacteria bacterium RBG_16_67_15]